MEAFIHLILVLMVLFAPIALVTLVAILVSPY